MHFNYINMSQISVNVLVLFIIISINRAAESLRELSPNQRKCLYPDESYPVFGKTICNMKCRSRLAMDMCNCVPHFYPYVEGPKCTPSGYECLLDFKWPGWTAALCNCTRTCIGVQYPVLQISKRSWSSELNSSLAFASSIMIELVPPKVRNRISVVFSFEDLLVSFGGAASLFLGFSFWAALQSAFYWIKYLTAYLLEVRRRSNRVESVVV